MASQCIDSPSSDSTTRLMNPFNLVASGPNIRPIILYPALQLDLEIKGDIQPVVYEVHRLAWEMVIENDPHRRP